PATGIRNSPHRPCRQKAAMTSHLRASRTIRSTRQLWIDRVALTDSAPALARPAGFHRPGGALDSAFASLASSRKGLAIAALLYWLAVLLPLGSNVAGIFLNGVRLVLLVTIVPMTFRLLTGRYGKV